MGKAMSSVAGEKKGRVFPRGKRWWVAYYAPNPETGRREEKRESGGRSEAEARKLLSKKLREVANADEGLQPFIDSKQKKLTIFDILKLVETDYIVNKRKSWRKLNGHLKHIREHFGLSRVMSVTDTRLKEYVALRQREGAANATINRELDGLQRGFTLAVEERRLAAHLKPNFPNLPEHNARQGFFERAEFEGVMQHLTFRGEIDADLQDFCEWFYMTAMRPGEIKSLTWAALDRETMVLRLHDRDAKTGFNRKFTLVGTYRAIIERRLKARRIDCNLIFHRRGRLIGQFYKVWRRACQLAGVPGKLIYDFRRTAIRNMIRSGVPEEVAMKVSGHRTRSMLARYNITSDKDILDALGKTDAYVATLPTDYNVTPLHKGLSADCPKRRTKGGQ